MGFHGAPTARSVPGGPRTAIAGPAPAIVRRTRSLRLRCLARGDVSENWQRASRRETASGSCTPLWLGGRSGRATRRVWRSNCLISCTFACCGPRRLRRASKTPGLQFYLDAAMVATRYTWARYSSSLRMHRSRPSPHCKPLEGLLAACRRVCAHNLAHFRRLCLLARCQSRGGAREDA